jgi:hypothetical protein
MSLVGASAFSHVGLAVSFFSALFFLLASYNQNTKSYHLHKESSYQYIIWNICALSRLSVTMRPFDLEPSRSKGFTL